MSAHNDTGKEGEELGATYLISLGYEILHRNWRHSYYELDVIAKKDGLLRIVEIKCLKSAQKRFPEENVTKKKFRDLRKAADEFLFQHPDYRDLRFEILSIILHPFRETEYFLITDVSL
jgi:putative endonuclease